MSAQVSGVIAAEGAKDAGAAAAAVTPMAGGAILTPLPLGGGKRKSRKLSKKVLKMLKKMGPSKVVKMIKKGGDVEGTGDDTGTPMGGRRHRGSKKTRRHSRRKHY